MKHFLFCLFCLCLLPAFVIAQEAIGTDEAVPYNGKPIVYIVGEDTPEKIIEFKPIPFAFSGDIAIQTPFGQKTTAAFVPQTTDFSTIVKILGTGDVVVEEYIQLMNTSNDMVFKRTWPHLAGVNFTLTGVQRNGTPAAFVFNQQNDIWQLKETIPLAPGVHNFKISYLLKNTLTKQNGMATLKLSLTGPDWPLPVERFSSVVLFPKKTPLIHQDMLFGANEVLIPEAVKIQVDAKGNVLYTLTRPLPAKADVHLNIGFDESILIKPSLIDLAFEQMNHTLFWLCALALILYTCVTLAYLKYKKTGSVLKELSNYSLPALHFIITHKTDVTFLKQAVVFLTWQKKGCRTLTLLTKIKNRFPKIGYGLLKACIWANILRKYILTMGLMITLVVFQAANVGIALSVTSILLLIVFTLCLLVVIYVKGERLYIAREMWAFERLISNKNIGFGLSAASMQALFVQFYPYCLALEQQKEWINTLKLYKINLTAFTFLEKSGERHE